MEGRSVGFDFSGLGRLLVRGVRGQLLLVLWSFGESERMDYKVAVTLGPAVGSPAALREVRG